MVTAVAWLPYVISWFVSRSLLSGRDSKAVLVFIAVAVGVAALSVACYLNLLEMMEAPSPLLISAGVTIALVLAAGLCAAIWRSDVAE